MIIYVEKTHDDANIRTTYNDQSAAFDIASVEDVVIEPHNFKEVDVGLKMCPKDPNYYLIFHTRSSFGKRGLRVHPGVIDWGFVGPLSVIVYNHTDQPQHINKGDFVAQVTLELKQKTEFNFVNNISDFIQGERGTNGFGSTN